MIYDNFIIKGNVTQKNDQQVEVSFGSNSLVIEKTNIEKIELKERVRREPSQREYTKEKAAKESYADFFSNNSAEQGTSIHNQKSSRLDKAKEKRGKSIVALGAGVGLQYGLVGYGLEFLLFGHLGIASGIDMSPAGMKNFNVKWYFGDKGDKFRIRIGYLRGDTKAIEINYYGYGNKETDYDQIKGKAFFGGFKWKMNNWLSCDFDLSYVMHDQDSYTATYKYSLSHKTFKKNHFAPAIGLSANF
ncbi:MAG: hypothetical protein GY817_04830 [bacterium]|nr:hypothetical protein [bacterium]